METWDDLNETDFIMYVEDENLFYNNMIKWEGKNLKENESSSFYYFLTKRSKLNETFFGNVTNNNNCYTELITHKNVICMGYNSYYEASKAAASEDEYLSYLQNSQIFEGFEGQYTGVATLLQKRFFLADKFDEIALRTFETRHGYDANKIMGVEIYGMKKTLEKQKILSDAKRSDLVSVHLLTIMGFGYFLAMVIFALEYFVDDGLFPYLKTEILKFRLYLRGFFYKIYRSIKSMIDEAVIYSRK